MDDQITAVRAAWPSFKAKRLDNRCVTWRGQLRPLLQTYDVHIAYRAPLVIELPNPLRQQPRVRILSPALRQRPGDREGDLPHVYWDHPVHPALCLFDHETGEWAPGKLLAQTTIPWTIDWLGCYEGWRATGEWTGGGRHASPNFAQESTA